MKKIIISSLIIILLLGLEIWFFKSQRTKIEQDNLNIPRIEYPQNREIQKETYPDYDGKG